MNSRKCLSHVTDFQSPCERTLVVVPCGAQKVWGRNPGAGKIPAKEAYTSQLFKAYREYAEAFGTDWLIVSARYGLTDPDQLIENYNCRFTLSDLEPRNWWRLEGLVKQARSLPHYDRVILLGSKLYRGIVKKALLNVVLRRQIAEPFAGCDLPNNDQIAASCGCL